MKQRCTLIYYKGKVYLTKFECFEMSGLNRMVYLILLSATIIIISQPPLCSFKFTYIWALGLNISICWLVVGDLDLENSHENEKLPWP